MNTRILNMVAVAVVSIFVGVALTVFYVQNSLMARLEKQQTEILYLQQAMAAKMEDKTLEKKFDELVSALTGARRAAQPPSDEYTKVHDIVVAHSPLRGPQDAKVTIVEFVDFQCPYCSRFHPAVNEVLEAYPQDVNYMIKHYPLNFHPQALPASKAVLAAGRQGKFFEMADLILKNNQGLNDEKFEQLAKELGLNLNRFRKDYKDRDAEWEKIISADMALGSRVDVRGTPTYYINGRKTRARTLDTFKKEIDSILDSGK